ncbi:MAG: polyphosphate polymerase domain-containing protein [Bradymonadales bacterium]|nr:polyphosphate polymerase domain-containing protein [Bradymonadales bacterium]
MYNHASFIERFELKYLIDEETASRIRKYALTFCQPDRHNPPPPQVGYLIKTLYLDTPSFAFHRAKMDNHSDRFKLRIRSYDDTGPIRFEIKRKVIDVIHKRRATVPRSAVARTVEGYLPDQPGLAPGERNTLEQFARIAARTGARPVTLVCYQREAYVSEIDNYGRVTFDRKLVYQAMEDWDNVGDPRCFIPLDGYWLYDGMHSPVILELKCEVRVPIWISDIIRGFNLRQQGFSKYSHSILAQARLSQGQGIHRKLAGMNYV